MPKRFHKHKLLLDENLPPRTVFPRLNSIFDVKHVQDDLNRGGLPDSHVYQLAVNQQRILLTLLILLFSQPNFTKRQIVIGQYLSFIVIILVSTVGFLSKFLLSLAWIGFLGIVPIIMGVRRISSLIRMRKPREAEVVSEDKYTQANLSFSFARVTLEPLLDPQTYRVMLLGIGNGSDNITTYTPLFASGSFIRVIVLICLYLARTVHHGAKWDVSFTRSTCKVGADSALLLLEME